jgi:saccharopine dehydrogenase-like NADP-dependent oxidoreductase
MIFDPEDAGDIFLLNIGSHRDYTTLLSNKMATIGTAAVRCSNLTYKVNYSIHNNFAEYSVPVDVMKEGGRNVFQNLIHKISKNAP